MGLKTTVDPFSFATCRVGYPLSLDKFKRPSRKEAFSSCVCGVRHADWIAWAHGRKERENLLLRNNQLCHKGRDTSVRSTAAFQRPYGRCGALFEIVVDAEENALVRFDDTLANTSLFEGY